MDSVVKSNPFDLTLHGLDVFENLRTGVAGGATLVDMR